MEIEKEYTVHFSVGFPGIDWREALALGVELQTLGERANATWAAFPRVDALLTDIAAQLGVRRPSR